MGKERALINRFSGKKVLLIGDSILDVYVHGTAIGKSLETPTIVAKETSTKVSFGGASLVARNLLELGAHVDFISVIGNDEAARHYAGFTHKNLSKRFTIDPSRSTTIKKRFWVDGYKMLQFDNLDNRDISPALASQVLSLAKDSLGACDAVVISDYRHGMLTADLIAKLKKLFLDTKKPVFVDSQISHREGNHALYKDLFMILLNEKEAKTLDPNFSGDFGALTKALGKSNICVKLGEKGSACLFKGKPIMTSGLLAKPIDTCGAGDAFLAALALGDQSDMGSSLRIANHWAGLSIQVQGPEPPKKEDLLKSFS